MNVKKWGFVLVGLFIFYKVFQLGVSQVGRNERRFIQEVCGMLKPDMPLDLNVLQTLMEKERVKLYSVSFKTPATLPTEYKKNINQLELQKISELIFIANGFFTDKETLKINIESGLIKKVNCTRN